MEHPHPLEAFTVADDLSWLVMEQAFRKRFVTYFDGMISFVNVKTGDEDSMTVQSFEDVFQAVTRGGSYAKSAWQLKLRSTGQPLEFRATFAHLLKWAREEGLLHGQRNRRTEEVYRRIRNHVAHPTYHLRMPPDAARTIHDLAEIINRLWGAFDPWGSLVPGAARLAGPRRRLEQGSVGVRGSPPANGVQKRLEAFARVPSVDGRKAGRFEDPSTGLEFPDHRQGFVQRILVEGCERNKVLRMRDICSARGGGLHLRNDPLSSADLDELARLRGSDAHRSSPPVRQAFTMPARTSVAGGEQSCSHTRITVQPAARRWSDCRLSRSLFSANFGSQ